MIREDLMYSDYLIWKKKTSKIDSGKILNIIHRFRCPHCKLEQLPMEHGAKRICIHCGLKMILHGNNLECSL